MKPRAQLRVKLRHRYGRWTLSRVDANNKEKAAGVFKTKREAVAARDALLVDVRRGAYVEPSTRTLADWWSEWSASRKALSPNSRAVERVYWSRWILPELGEVAVQQLGPGNWERLDDAMIAAGLSGKYRRNVRGSLRRAFADAERLGYVYRNPIALTSPPSVEGSRRREAFTVEEMRALLDVQDRLAPIWRLAFESGCRRGELCGLRDEDVDGARIRIRRQRLVRPTRDWQQDRVYTRETTKSGRERAVVVSDEMAAVLRRWKAQRLEERLAFGPAYDDAGWLSCEADGSPIAPDTLSARFNALERRAGVRHLGLHSCRHTHATLALAGGARLDVVSRQLGHSSVSVTGDIYSHPDETALAEEAAIVGRAIERRGK
jgi:integrase